MTFFVLKLVGLAINAEVYMKKDPNSVNKMICNFGAISKHKKTESRKPCHYRCFNIPNKCLSTLFVWYWKFWCKMFNVLSTCTYTRKKNPNRMSLINRLIGNKALQNTMMLSCYSLYFTVHLENLLDVTEIPRIISIFSDEVNVCVFYSLY